MTTVRPSNRPYQTLRLLLTTVLLLSLPCVTAAQAERQTPGKVLVVMSYDDKNDSEAEIARGIDEVLNRHTVRYFYLDAKNHLDQASVRAQKAFTLYREFKPDVVIAADDTAQEVFIQPYLLNKTSTPVIFCGVNDTAENYGYPTKQVTGIIEKKHYRQSIGFAQLIDPGIDKIAVVYRDTPANATNLAQIKREKTDYGAVITSLNAVNSRTELLATITRLESEADALLVLNLAGIAEQSGENMEQSAAMTLAAKAWPKLSIAVSKNEIEDGILCGVVKINKEQGLVAAKMAIDILKGKKPADLPMTENQNGQRMINAVTANRLGIKLKPMVLIGTELVQ